MGELWTGGRLVVLSVVERRRCLHRCMYSIIVFTLYAFVPIANLNADGAVYLHTCSVVEEDDDDCEY